MGKARAVTVTSSKDTSGKISFEMVEDGKKTDTLVFDKTKDNMKKSEHYDIQFTLVNTDGLKLEFLQDTKHVMWVAKGDKSSPRPVQSRMLPTRHSRFRASARRSSMSSTPTRMSVSSSSC